MDMTAPPVTTDVGYYFMYSAHAAIPATVSLYNITTQQ